MDILEKFYYGINPGESILNDDIEMRRLSRNATEKENAFTLLLDDKQKEVFEEFNNAILTYHDAEVKHRFIDGFSLGLTMGAQACDRIERYKENC